MADVSFIGSSADRCSVWNSVTADYCGSAADCSGCSADSDYSAAESGYCFFRTFLFLPFIKVFFPMS